MFKFTASRVLFSSIRQFSKKNEKVGSKNDPQLKDPKVEVFKERKLTGTGSDRVEEKGFFGVINQQIPATLRARRVARIYQRPKHVMQQGTDNTRTWILDFSTEKRWENPLMGWCSSGDSLSNLHLEFPSECAAICFAEKQGIKWVQEPLPKKKTIKKSYNDIFSWDKRTRVSTK